MDPKMHCHNELLEDRKSEVFLSNETIHKWFNDRYSTSKHLLTLYSVVIGIKAKSILEIGFGRSSFILAKAAKQNEGIFTAYDTKNFQYLLNESELDVTNFVQGTSAEAWKTFKRDSLDFVFMDYLSSESASLLFCTREILAAISRTRLGGVIAIHDAAVQKYNIKTAIRLIAILANIKITKPIKFVILPYNYGLALLTVGECTGFGDSDPWKKKDDKVRR